MKSTFKSILYFEGLFFALMVATTESYLMMFLAKQGMKGVGLAIFSTLPIFLASLSQLKMPQFFPREKITSGILFFILVQILGLILIQFNGGERIHIALLLSGLSLYWIGGQNVAPLWLDFVSLKIMKENFAQTLSFRNSLVTYSTMFFFIFFSYFFESYVPFEKIFMVGLVARILSFVVNLILILKFKVNAQDIERTNPKINLNELSQKENAESDHIINHYLICGALFRFFCNIASPFFITYMLLDLKLSNPEYVWLAAAPYLGRALFLSNWARASDFEGAQYGIQLSGLCISLLPWLWTLSDNYFYLIFLQLFSGLFWGGQELTHILMHQNFNYGNSRGHLARQQAIFAFAAVLGGLLGGFLLAQNYQIFKVFEISSMLRFLSALGLIFMMRKFQISRLNLNKSKRYLFSVLSLRPSLVNIMRAIPSSSKD
jgi:hypothetical protein